MYRSAIKAVRKMQQIYTQKRREGLAQIWTDFTKQLVSTRTRQGLASAARKIRRQAGKSRTISRSAIIRSKQASISRVSPEEQQRIGRKNLHLMRLRRKQWHLMSNRLKRLRQAESIAQLQKQSKDSAVWKSMARALISEAKGTKLAQLKNIEREATSVALEYVNELLLDFGIQVKSLSELPKRTQTDENRKIPVFDSNDEVMGVFVNRQLSRYCLPILPKDQESESKASTADQELASESEDMTDSETAAEIVREILQPRPIVKEDPFDDAAALETVRTINFRVALMSFTRPKLRQISTITEKDITLYVNNKSAFDIVDDIFASIEFPLGPNVVTEETALEIIKDHVFDGLDEFMGLDVRGLEIYEQIDEQRYVNAKEADAVIDWLFSEIRLPICENDVDDQAVIEIAEDDLFDTFPPLCEKGDKLEILDGLGFKDLQFYANGRMAENLMDEFYAAFHLPIEPNVASEETLWEIVEKSYDDLLPPFSSVDIRPVSEFSRKIILDPDVIYGTVAQIVKQQIETMPVISNDVTQKALDDILADDEFWEVFEIFDLDGCDPVERYECKDPCVYANDRYTEGIAEVLLSCVDLPIVENNVTEKAVEEILEFYDFSDVAEIGELHLSCLSVPPKDLQLYVNSRVTDSVTGKIFSEIRLPIIPNTVDDAAIAEIADEDLIDTVFGVFEDDSGALRRFQFKDIQFYVNEKTTGEMMDVILKGVQLPIGPNVVTQKAIDDILSEDYGDVVPWFSDPNIDPLNAVHPSERRIDFNFPVSEEEYLRNILEKLPICPNVCTDATAEEISRCIGEVEFFDYDVRDVRPLQEYHAPAEVFENIDDVVERLMVRVLQRDILPAMPLTEDAYVEDSELEEIVDDMIEDNKLFGDVADFAGAVGRLVRLPSNEIPSYIAPEDVMEQLLWNDVLPFMPLVSKNRRNRDIRDTIDAIVLDNYAQGQLPADESDGSDDEDYPFRMISRPPSERKTRTSPVKKP